MSKTPLAGIMQPMNVTALPAFQDNYIWLIQPGHPGCAVVDPGDAKPVIEAVESRQLRLEYILITHHHPDHVGGLEQLVRRYAPVVFGPVDDRITGIGHVLREGDIAELPRLRLRFRVIEIPGHTATHIAFYGHGSLFCGDTLFSVGCGRLFEGTPEQMQSSLDKLAALPAETLVYCGHEYTLSNCRFALRVEPGNTALQKRADEARQKRDAQLRTVPSRLGEELEVNPFLRTRTAAVVAAARGIEPAAQPGASVLGVIRRWKDAG